MEKEEDKIVHPWNKSKYTDSGGSNSKFGGWNEAGLVQYKTFLAGIQESRKNELPRLKKVEKAMFKALRKYLGIKENEKTAEEKRKNAKKRSRASKSEDEERRKRIAALSIVPTMENWE